MARAVKPSGKRVVLVWNEHPTEVVAGFHARKVAKILKEKYGHRVILKKIAFRKTNTGIIAKSNNPIEIVGKIVSLKDSIEIARHFARKHKAAAFNFHASPNDTMANAVQLNPTEFRVGESPRNKDLHFEVQFLGHRKHFAIEVPALFVDLPKKQHEKQEGKLDFLEAFFRTAAPQRIWKTRRAKKKLFGPLAILAARKYLTYTPLKHPAQQKYLHPAISEKIAAAIHARLMGGK